MRYYLFLVLQKFEKPKSRGVTTILDEANQHYCNAKGTGTHTAERGAKSINKHQKKQNTTARK